VKAAPTERDAKLALLQVLAASRSLEEAEKEMATLLAASPKDYPLRLGFAEFYEANGSRDKAEQAYRDMIREAGKTPPAQTARSRLAILKVQSSQFDEAAELTEAVLAENPADADALAVRAEIALNRGDTAAAIADLRVAFGNQPDSVPLAVALARAHLQGGQQELAEQTLRSVVQANPGDIRARFALAQFLSETGKAAQARPVLEQLVAEQPNNLLALEGLARLQVGSKDLEGARRSVAAIQALSPNSAKGYVMAGQIEQYESVR
jgi:predicted Zn-dependent protease